MEKISLLHITKYLNMTYKTYSKALIFSIMFSSLFSNSMIAVLDFEGKGIKQEEASTITDRLRLEITQLCHKSGDCSVMNRDQMGRILKEQKLQQSGCVSNSCMVEIGEIIGVETIIGGSIGKIGNLYSINAQEISVETGEILDFASYDYDGAIGQLLTAGTRYIASKLIYSETTLGENKPAVGTIWVNAPGCDILLNDSYEGKDYLLKDLIPDYYFVKAQKENHYTVEKEVLITKGEEEDITFDLLPIEGSVYVLVDPIEASNADIYIGNQLKGPAPKKLTLLIGQYDIEVKHENYLSQKQTVLINQNQTQRLNFNLNTYKGSIQRDIDKWNKRKKLSLLGTIAFIGAGIYFQQSGMDYYDKYKVAENEDDAIAFRNSTEQADLNYNISIGVGATLGFSWLYSWFKENRYIKKNN